MNKKPNRDSVVTSIGVGSCVAEQQRQYRKELDSQITEISDKLHSMQLAYAEKMRVVRILQAVTLVLAGVVFVLVMSAGVLK